MSMGSYEPASGILKHQRANKKLADNLQILSTNPPFIVVFLKYTSKLVCGDSENHYMQVKFSYFSPRRYSSHAEQIFCEKKLEERAANLAFITYSSTILLAIAVPLVSFFGVNDRRHFDELVFTHLGIACLLLTRPIFKKMGLKLKHFMPPISMLYVFSLAYVIHADIQNQINPTSSTLLVAFCAMGVFLLLPFSGYIAQVSFGAIILSSVVLANQGLADTSVTHLVMAFGILLAIGFRNAMEHDARSRFIDQFQSRSRHIPKNILTKSAISGRSINDLFAPTLRDCICISSDWRNYQALAQSLPDATLAQLLSDYYGEINKLTEQYIPSGNYFSDWIADELFLVLYAEEGVVDTTALANQAIELCRAIIYTRQKFWDEHGAPEAIDFGIAAGRTFVGVIGPQGHTKATALGELPGRARRLQTFGKTLREKYGHCDRLIFGIEVKELLATKNCQGIQESSLQNSLRNINDEKLFFTSIIEHKVAA